MKIIKQNLVGIFLLFDGVPVIIQFLNKWRIALDIGVLVCTPVHTILMSFYISNLYSSPGLPFRDHRYCLFVFTALFCEYQRAIWNCSFC